MRTNSSATPLTFTTKVWRGQLWDLPSKTQTDCPLLALGVSLPRARDPQLPSVTQVDDPLAQVLHGYRPLCTGGQRFQLVFWICTTGSSWKRPHLSFQLSASCHCLPPPLEENRQTNDMNQLFCRPDRFLVLALQTGGGSRTSCRSQSALGTA